MFRVIQKLKASDIHNVSLFTNSFLNELNRESFKLMILPFVTWLNHSILTIILSQNKEGRQMLEQFDLAVDRNQLVSDFPIPHPSHLMIPLDDSDYALVITKHDCDFNEMALNNIMIFKTLLTRKLEITDYALNIVAIHIKQNFLYWLAPKSVMPVIKTIYNKVQYDLLDGGVTVAAIYPSRLFKDSFYNMKSDPFDFLLLSVWNLQ